MCALGVGSALNRSRVRAPVDAVVAGTRLTAEADIGNNKYCTVSTLSSSQDINYCLSYTVQLQSRRSAKLFLRSSELGPPTSSPACESAPPLFGSGGGAYSLAREGPRGWESPKTDEGAYPVVLFIYISTLCCTLLF